MLINDAIELFLIDNKLKGNSLKTLFNYERFLFYFVDYAGNINIADITLKLLKEYHLHLTNREFHLNHIRIDIAGTQLNKTTIQSYVRHLRVFINYLYDEELIDKKLTDKFKLPKAPKKFKNILNDKQIIEIFKQFPVTELGQRNLCMVALMIDSGLRVNEVCTLTIPCIDFIQNTIKITGKGSKDRIVPLGINTKKYLMKYLKVYRSVPLVVTDRIFISNQLIPINKDSIQSVIYRLKVKLKYDDLSPHLFRHTFATKYLINGGDIFSLQMILGHSDLEMVKHYSHIANSYMLNKHRRFSPLDVLSSASTDHLIL